MSFSLLPDTHTPQRWTSCCGCKSRLELMLLQMQWQNLFFSSLKCWWYLSWAWWRGDPVYSATECSSWRARPRPPLRRCGPPSGSGSDRHPAGKPGHRSLLSHNPTNSNTSSISTTAQRTASHVTLHTVDQLSCCHRNTTKYKQDVMTLPTLPRVFLCGCACAFYSCLK